MRPQLNLRAPALLGAAGVLLIGMTDAGSARASEPTADGGGALAMSVSDATLGYGQTLVVQGRVDPARAGTQLALQFRARGEDWRVAQTAAVGTNGGYRFRARPDRSGDVRVTLATPEAMAAARGTGSASAPRATDSGGAASATRTISVAASIAGPRTPIAVNAGRKATLRGVLRPARAGRQVVLEARGRKLARARTNSRGEFRLRWRAAGASTRTVRIRFSGDGANDAAVKGATVNAFRLSYASWYEDGGATACGTHARFGVAHRTLPCGTKVAIRYRGRSVVATVDDRGPFVGGRDWDLNGAVAGRLGFDGTGAIWVTA
jgi:hypothetical protein